MTLHNAPEIRCRKMTPDVNAIDGLQSVRVVLDSVHPLAAGPNHQILLLSRQTHHQCIDKPPWYRSEVDRFSKYIFKPRTAACQFIATFLLRYASQLAVCGPVRSQRKS